MSFTGKLIGGGPFIGAGVGGGHAVASGPPPAFTPVDLGVKLLAWWNADDLTRLTLVGGATVSHWLDFVANLDMEQLTAGAQPAYEAAGFNGAPCLTFDGVDDCLVKATSNLPNGVNPMEVWGSVQQDALVADTTVRVAFSHGNTSNTRRMLSRIVTAAVNRVRATSGTGAAEVNADETTVALSGRHVIHGIWDADGVTSQADAGVSSKAAVAMNTTNARARIGANCGGTAGTLWQGKIRDIIVTLPLTAGERTDMSAYLAARL